MYRENIGCLARTVGRDPWMVPTRTMNPVWSPDGKWIAYSKHLNSLYRAIEVVNVETGESKQVTDGLADAISPAWDASGKYLWFLASTDVGLRSQWLDMSTVPPYYPSPVARCHKFLR